MKKQNREVSDFNWRFWIPIIGPIKAIRNFAKRDGPSPMYDSQRNISSARQTIRGLKSYAWLIYSMTSSGAMVLVANDYIAKGLEYLTQ